MTKTKNTKRALLTSALALLMCVSMLIGSTFAWFTDSVTSSGNIIKSGTLDVTMEWADGTKAVPADDSSDWTDASTGAIFNYDKWEPGYVSVRHIKIANEGTLALKYQINIIANGEVSDLADVIDVYYVDPAVQVTDRTQLTDANKLGTLSAVLEQISTTASGNLLAGESDTVTLALKMQESAGNQYQGLSIGSEFAVQLMATQLTSETDSFNNQYDAEADYVVYYNTPGTYTLNATLMATTATDVITATGEGVVVDITGGYYDAGSQDCAVWAKDGATVNIYDGTFICDGQENTDSANHQDMIYAGSNSGKINIYGGFFSSRNNAWLLNEKDNQGEIVVYGGTFVNWNPADNVSEGPDTSFVAGGYDVIVETKGEDTYYTVVEGTVVSTAAELADALTAGGNVVLGADIAIDEGIVLADGTILDLNGHTLTDLSTNGRTLGIQDGVTVTVNGDGKIAKDTTVASEYAMPFYVSEDSTLTVNGGIYPMGTSGTDYNILLQNNGTLIINDGVFTNTGNTGGNSLIYAVDLATVKINGGYFESVGAVNPDLLNTLYYGTITISGGTFVNYNPAEDNEGAKLEQESGGQYQYGVIVADGYKVVSETQENGDIWYTVVAE